MKAVILAGGLGTRMAEETDIRPKPMVEIGGRPLLWHIMKLYAAHDVRDFVICLGYKGYSIKEYFLNYYLHTADMTLDLRTGEQIIHNSKAEDWRVTLVDTGAQTMTGGRLKRIRRHIEDAPFCMTYGDGLADIDITAEIAFHHAHGKQATVAAVQPPGRFGVLTIASDDRVERFEEKPSDEIGWINGGFFVLDPAVLDRIEGDDTYFERAPLRGLAADGELRAYSHRGFWRACDTLRDKRDLEHIWATETPPPWKVWTD